MADQPLRAIWSFWSKPYWRQRRSGWASELHHWLAWKLSVEMARQHYPDYYARCVNGQPSFEKTARSLSSP